MIIKTAWIECDVCEVNQFPNDLWPRSGAEARHEAHRVGWVTEGGEDICPECQSDPIEV